MRIRNLGPCLHRAFEMSGEMGPVLGCLLVILSAPMMVWGQVNLFVENFDDPELVDWGGPILMKKASFTANSGYAFCNLSGVDPTTTGGSQFKAYSIQRFLYAGIEMRVRLSSDNKLETDVGGGTRRWGFRSGSPQYSLSFRSLEQGMISAFDTWYPGHPGNEMIGFCASTRINDEFVFWQKIEGIDLTEWHTYTILWQPEVATFLIDDVVVAITERVPQIPMRIYLRAASGENLTLQCKGVGGEEVSIDECIQVDYIRVFSPDSKFEEMDSEVSGLFAQALPMLDELEQRGENTTNLRAEYGKAQHDWQKDHYVYDEARPRLEKIIEAIENWDEIFTKFAQASECIGTLEGEVETRDATMLKAFLSKAEETWQECNCPATNQLLDNIIAKCPIPEALTVLSLILLPALHKVKRSPPRL